MRPFYGLVAVALLSANGCSRADSKASSELARLQIVIDSLSREVASVKQANALRELSEGWDEFAYLPIGSDGYSVLKIDVGGVSVSLADVQPYANGARITLQFGNATSATLNDISFKLDWGRMAKAGGPDNESARSKPVTLSRNLPGGSWVKVQVVIEAIPFSELGFVRVSEFKHTGMSLRVI